MYNIRPAEEADQTTIRKMVREARLDPTTLKWQNFLVAEAEGQIVGIGQIKRYPDCQELGSLVVLPAYRSQGIAAALIEALERGAQRPLYLLCEQKMQPFYERFGYSVIQRGEAPRTIRTKLRFTLPFRIFGIRVVAMRKL